MSKQLFKTSMLLFLLHVGSGFSQSQWPSIKEASNFIMQAFHKIGNTKIPDETLNPDGVDIDFQYSRVNIDDNTNDVTIYYSVLTQYSSGKYKRMSCRPETDRRTYEITFNLGDVDYVSDTGYVVKKYPGLCGVLFINLKKGRTAIMKEGGLNESGKQLECTPVIMTKVPLYYSMDVKKKQVIDAMMYASGIAGIANTRLFFSGKQKNPPTVEEVTSFLCHDFTSIFQAVIRMEGFVLSISQDGKPYETIDFNHSAGYNSGSRMDIRYSMKTKGQYLPLPCDSSTLGTSQEYDFDSKNIIGITEDKVVSEQQGVKVGLLLLNLKPDGQAQINLFGGGKLGCTNGQTTQVPVYYDAEYPKYKEYILKAVNYLIKNTPR